MTRQARPLLLPGEVEPVTSPWFFRGCIVATLGTLAVLAVIGAGWWLTWVTLPGW